MFKLPTQISTLVCSFTCALSNDKLIYPLPQLQIEPWKHASIIIAHCLHDMRTGCQIPSGTGTKLGLDEQQLPFPGIELNQLYTQQTILRSEQHFPLPKNRRTYLQHSHQLEHKLLQYNNIGQHMVQTRGPLAAILLSIKADLLHENISRRRRFRRRRLKDGSRSFASM